MKLGKEAMREVESRTRDVEFKSHNGFLAIQEYLFEHHGECKDPDCPQAVIVQQTPTDQHPKQRLRHLAHHPVSPEIVEAALMAGVRKLLHGGIIVATARETIQPEAILQLAKNAAESVECDYVGLLPYMAAAWEHRIER